MKLNERNENCLKKIIVMASMFVTSITVQATVISEGSIEIITAAELLKKIEQVSIIDARDSGFLKGHIPQSQSLDWQDFTEEKPGLLNAFLGHPEKWGRVLNSTSVQIRLRKLGLSQSRLIVVVGSPEGWGEDGRVAWNLLYWGAENVALLDGGFEAWKKLGYPIKIGYAQSVTEGDFTLKIAKDRRAEVNDVKEILKTHSRRILDARSLDEFKGKLMPGQKRGGRIPGSSLVELKKLYQPDGKFISAKELKKLIGEELTSSPITYCTGGVRSGLLALLIEARLGMRSANYDASMWEWSQDLKLPVENDK